MKDFKIGDWVYIPAINEKGEVLGGCIDTTWNEKSYHVRMEDGRELDVLESNCKLADYDPKTAFIEELSELLRKYDARINLGIRTEDRVCGVVLEVNNEDLFYPVKIEDMSNDPTIIYQIPQSNYPLTADNIFNYEKE